LLATPALAQTFPCEDLYFLEDAYCGQQCFRELLERSDGVPHRLVTDRLGSYRAAHRTIMPSVVHDTTRYTNNRAEVSHQPMRRRQRWLTMPRESRCEPRRC
jgi:transposase-like protein